MGLGWIGRVAPSRERELKQQVQAQTAATNARRSLTGA